MVDIIVRIVQSYGFLPIVTVDGKEVYRGEFQERSTIAFEKGLTWVVENME